MGNIFNWLVALYLRFEIWAAEQPYNVRWAVACAKIGVVVLIVELTFVIMGVINWPVIIITAMFFGIGTATMYSDEYWNGPRGD